MKKEINRLVNRKIAFNTKILKAILRDRRIHSNDFIRRRIGVIREYQSFLQA